MDEQAFPPRLFIRPAVMEPELETEGWWPARLMSPMRYDEAECAGPAGQHTYLEQILAEDWWREGINERFCRPACACRLPCAPTSGRASGGSMCGRSFTLPAQP
jgi:hypothetical protein